MPPPGKMALDISDEDTARVAVSMRRSTNIAGVSWSTRPSR